MPTARSPKHRPAILATSIAALLSLGLLLAPPRATADEYWDGTTSSGGSGIDNGKGGAGTWDTTTANWVNKSGTNPHVFQPDQLAIFATTGGAVTLGSDITF